MNIYKVVFGSRLKEAREHKKITQAKLAEKTGVEPASVSRWESGKIFPEEHRLPDICKTLGVSVEYFIHGNGRLADGINQIKKVLTEFQIAEANKSLPGDIGEIVGMLSSLDEDQLARIKANIRTLDRPVRRKRLKKDEDVS